MTPNAIAEAKRCGKRHIRTIVAMVVVLLCAVRLSAQEVDFLKYKFYEDDYTETLLLLQEDTITSPLSSRNTYHVNDYNIRNALYNSGFRSRGTYSDEESYIIGGITLQRSTAQRLIALGIARYTERGLGGAMHSGTTLSTTTLSVGRGRAMHSDKQTIRTEISGQNYLVGVSHKGSWMISPTGVNLKGDWEINHNIRIRTGRDIYVEGVFSNAVDCAIEASHYTQRHSISLAATLSYSNRGLRQHTSEEAFSLLNNPLYNPLWGMQNGKVRNSRVRNTLRPDIVALWEYRLTAATTLHVTANIGFEALGTTSLEWFDAMTPMPDNYRYMPSYHSQDAQQMEVTEAWMNNDLRYTQIDWQGMYHTNALQSDGSARYAVAKRRENITNTSFSAHISSNFADIDFSGGIRLNYDVSRNFKVIDDLLGAEYIIDRDYYLINDATYSNNLQNNLRDPNRKITEGDRYAYDYRLNRLRTTLFGTAAWEYDNGSVAAGISLSTEATQRRGFFEKELFPSEGSYGRSARIRLMPYHLSARWQHFVNNHRFGVSALISGASPEIGDMFLQQDYNNRITRELSLATTLAFEANYGFVLTNKLTLEASLFSTTTLHNTSVVHYYDDLAEEFVDCVASNINTTVGGFEARANVVWNDYLNSTFMVTAFASRYTSVVGVELYSDADNRLIANSTADMRGVRCGAPEVAAYGDVELSLMGWRARAALHYCGARSVTPSFVRRSTRILNQAFAPECREILTSQQRLKDVVSLDFTLSKWFDIGKASLGIQLSAKNLLGTSNILSGYEQNRVRRVTTINGSALEPFANRVLYNYPRLFYLGITLRI